MIRPAWLVVADKELGQHEIDGEGNNPRVVEYHATTTLHATQDSVAWCSSFVNWCMKQAGLEGTDSAAAKSWLEWGEALESPLLGCVCVIRQRAQGHDAATGSTSGYHVGFWVGEKAGRLLLEGGNQSDSVKVSSFGLTTYEVVGYRWPKLA